MKITFNDATELVIQSADIQSDDGGLLIKTISASEEDLKTMFQDKTKTKKMVTIRFIWWIFISDKRHLNCVKLWWSQLQKRN